jgi:hypothetical protein
MKSKILQALKPKVASLGFTNEELESVAEQISETLQEDADEDQINAGIDAVIPYLKLSQSAATRIVNAQKKKVEKPKKKESPASPEAETESENPDEDKFNKLLAVIEEQNKKIDSLINKDQKATRRSIFESKLKELPPELRATKLKDFERMSFQDQEDFDNYISEVEEDIPTILQGLANTNLSATGKPFKSGALKNEATDDEVKNILNKFDL